MGTKRSEEYSGNYDARFSVVDMVGAYSLADGSGDLFQILSWEQV